MTGRTDGPSLRLITAGAPRPGQVWPCLDDRQRAWLTQAVEQTRHTPERIEAVFPAVGRRCGRAPLRRPDRLGLVHGTIDDAARLELLLALPVPVSASVLIGLYRHGDTGERRAVLRALPWLELTPAKCSMLAGAVVADALRTNDPRLVAAALGPAARLIGDDLWHDGVVKTFYLDIPLAAVADLEQRADLELARKVLHLVHERVAAGRDAPVHVHRILDLFPKLMPSPALLIELEAADPRRRAAAHRVVFPVEHGR
ncbi:sugar phosphate isomerase [Pseudonocardia sp. EV170527-09]|uniref:EboA domain-containing protein n=1 Tax=Pseudonocardia sp. EV170527-09 TaxID=2603411 RepID=UPI0011F31FBA|nr:EboA domain-containing protein [Pseudonocardia sp. EV170527-09]KAA1018361.1 sugar phosphate isomerase [Pseudonocardia sp. EV170527-09]